MASNRKRTTKKTPKEMIPVAPAAVDIPSQAPVAPVADPPKTVEEVCNDCPGCATADKGPCPADDFIPPAKPSEEAELYIRDPDPAPTKFDDDLASIWESSPDVSKRFRDPPKEDPGFYGRPSPVEPKAGDPLYKATITKLSVELSRIQREEIYHVLRHKDLHSVVAQPELLAGLSRLIEIVERTFKVETRVYDTWPVLLRVRGNKLALDVIAANPDSGLICGSGPEREDRDGNVMPQAVHQVTTMRAYRAKHFGGLEVFDD